MIGVEAWQSKNNTFEGKTVFANMYKRIVYITFQEIAVFMLEKVSSLIKQQNKAMDH